VHKISTCLLYVYQSFEPCVRTDLTANLQNDDQEDLKPSATPGYSTDHHPRCLDVDEFWFPGYKPSAAKSADEYARLDAEDESLARWKASLGIVPGATTTETSGPKARDLLRIYYCALTRHY
jgi:hypothetical protein